MHLKKIELFGFKSFADKTSLHFHEGITGIVGPNGCGKSNISDSFRWVLGEQSAKSMRGSKMHDVIFAGTSKRKPVNIAEATLTLSNENGELPIEYDEVSVTRRLYRTGESDYFINRKPVRMRDVQSLFLDSGIGKDSFSIFEQGKIDMVINHTPYERRYIFEEASGISRFLQRKKEALRKLEHVDQNLSRVRDIHQEVEKQIIVLEKQAEEVRIYKERRKEFEALEKSLHLAKWDHLSKKMGQAGNREKEQKERAAEIAQAVRKMQEELHRAKGDLAEKEEACRMRKEAVFNKRSEKEIQLRELQTLRDRMAEISSKEATWQKELEEMEQKRQLRDVESAEAKKTLAEVEKTLQEAEEARKEQLDKARILEEKVQQLRELQKRRNEEALKLLQKENQIESEMKQHTVRLEAAQDRQLQMTENREQALSLKGELEQGVKVKTEELSELSGAIERKKEAAALRSAECGRLREETEELENHLQALRKKLAEAEARQKVLRRLREEMQGFSKGSKRLLQQAGRSDSGLFGKLKGIYEAFTPKKGVEKAVSSVMRNYSQTLVVENKSDFDAVLAYAKENQLKDFSLICLEFIRQQGEAGRLADLGDHPVSRHFLGSVRVCPTIEEALESGIEAWTEEGYYLDKNRVLFSSEETESNSFMREAELKALDQEVADLEREKQKGEERLRAVREQLTEKKEALREAEKEVRQREMERMEIEFSLKRLKSDLEKAVQDGEKYRHGLEELQETGRKLQEMLAELSRQHVEEKARGEEARNATRELNEQLEAALSMLRSEEATLKEREEVYQKAAEEMRRLTHRINVLEVQEMESGRQQTRLKEELEKGVQEKEAFRSREGEAVRLLERIGEELEDVQQASAALDEEARICKQKIQEMERGVEEERERAQAVDAELYQSGVQFAQIESSRKALEEELYEHYQTSVEELRKAAVPLEKGIEASERELRALRRKLEDSGDINMTSIEEHEKHQERYRFLNKQIDDLESSKHKLIEIITQLDGESRKIFKETFERIRSNFRKNFGILFSGGEADLQFTESQDILEAGIEIVAKPPGKKMRSIQLMSGGEKCMTSIALLFAIFEVKPAPFCILDEIDAPLDDANIARFLNVVRQFIDRCQFIIITHNKRTMAIADRLYGVSMEEKGVSRLLSMEFSKEASPEPVLV